MVLSSASALHPLETSDCCMKQSGQTAISSYFKPELSDFPKKIDLLGQDPDCAGCGFEKGVGRMICMSSNFGEVLSQM